MKSWLRKTNWMMVVAVVTFTMAPVLAFAAPSNADKATGRTSGAANTPAESITINVNSGLSGCSLGDLLIAQVSVDTDGTPSTGHAISAEGGAAWTNMTGVVSASTPNFTTAMWYKIYDVATTTYTFSWTNANNGIGQIRCYTDVSTGNPVDGWTSTTGFGTAATSPLVNVTNADSKVVHFWASDGDRRSPSLTGHNEMLSQYSNNDDGASLAGGDLIAAAGSPNSAAVVWPVWDGSQQGPSPCCDEDSGEGNANWTGVSVVLNPAEADLEVTSKTDNVTEATAGASTLTYVITVTNKGTSDATNAVITDDFSAATPAGVLENCSYTADDSPDACASGFTPGPANGNINDTVDMANGCVLTYTALCEVADDAPAGDQIFNNASIAPGDQPDPVPTTASNRANDNDTWIIRESDLQVTKTSTSDDFDGQVAQGTEMTYTIEVTNDGPSVADNVTITDTLPAAVTYDSHVNNFGTCNTGSLPLITCDVGDLAVDATASVDITVIVDEDAEVGSTITNTATAASDSIDPDPQAAEDSVDSRVVVAVASEGTAVIAVQKFFWDGNFETSVTLTLQCTAGTYAPETVTVHPDPLEGLAPNMVEHIFVIDNIPDIAGNVCTVVEEAIPGYNGYYLCPPEQSTGDVIGDLCIDTTPGLLWQDWPTDSTACGWTDVNVGDSNLCYIVNVPAPVEVEVTKVWDMFGAETADVDDTVKLTLRCDAEILGAHKCEGGDLLGPEYCRKSVTLSGSDYDDEDGDYTGMATAVFSVIPRWYSTAVPPAVQQYTECFVREDASDNDAVEVDNDCGDDFESAGIHLAAGMGDECTITNTVFFEGIPTLSEWGMMIMALLMLGVGFVSLRRIV